MSRSNDTLYRQWLLLKKIPRFPSYITITALHAHLENEGYQVDIRTVQRDLDKLAHTFPLNAKSQGRTNLWYWEESAQVQDLPNMDIATALAFAMASSYLQSILPQTTLSLLQPYFQRADAVLSANHQSRLHNWPEKVAVIGHGPELLKPKIDSSIRQVVYEALMKERQIYAIYQPRNKDKTEYLIHPLGLVNRQNVIYLVCTLWNFKDIKQLALHRFHQAELREEAAERPESFNLQDYILKDYQFAYPLSDKPIKLQALFQRNAVIHLYETPLTEDQTLTTQADGRVLLQASLVDSLELRRWLSSFGSQVEVVGPDELRAFFVQEAKLIMEKYSVSN